MSTRVAVVTDSTCGLTAELARGGGLTVVPLQVVIGGQVFAEGIEVDPATVADRLRHRVPVSTSRPAPETFVAAYRAAAEAGAETVVSIHLCATMSGTGQSAQLAARDAPVRVEVVDSGTVGMGLGFAVLAAAEAAAAGAEVAEVVTVARRRAAGSSSLFYVDTLEYLRRGGRLGAAQALVGSALSVKPLLHLVDGQVRPLEKVRTASRAISRLAELAVARAGDTPVDLAVQHLASPKRAAGLAGELGRQVPGVGALYVLEVGAVVGAHAGPGMLAVVVSPR